MLPVKNILREYLNNDGDGDDADDVETTVKKEKEEEEDEGVEKEKEEEKEEKKDEKEEVEGSGISIDLSGSVAEVVPAEAVTTPPNTPELPPVQESPAPSSEAPAEQQQQQQQVLVFETEPSVKFAEHDTVFDTENQMEHRIRSKSADFDNGNDEDDSEEIKIMDEAPQAMDDFEDLDGAKGATVDDFETLE
jgi:hypothetical protein